MPACVKCSRSFELTERMLRFIEKVSPQVGGETLAISPPTHCPDCRKQRRMAFRNDYVLYQRKSSLSGASLLSIYPSDAPFPVYSHDEWWGDGWDAMMYGQDFDFSRPMFEQFAALRDRVPRVAVYVDNFCENCNFSNQLTMSKNCYLVFSGSSNESCLYGYRINNSRHCLDCLYGIECELCYQCIDAYSCYNCAHCHTVTSCSDSAFLYDCQSCHHCLFSVGLRNQSYCIENQQYSKEEYKKRAQDYALESRSAVSEIQQRFDEYVLSFPRKHANLKNVENVTGDNVQNAKNCVHVFDGKNLEDIYFGQFVQDSKDCMDVNYCCDNAALHYDVATSGIEAYQVIFSIDTWPTVNNLMYCDSCSNGTKDCFGCVGLRGKRYCIFNKQYSKEQYESLVGRIVQHMRTSGEWGEFFPPSIAPFGYNESVSFQYYPMSKEEALSAGFRWRDEEKKDYEQSSYRVADAIGEVKDDITQEKLSCSRCGKNFKIIAKELSFLRKQSLSVPEECPDCRHQVRFARRAPRQLYCRSCERCGVSVESPYAEERAETIYCESCYLEHAY